MDSCWISCQLSTGLTISILPFKEYVAGDIPGLCPFSLASLRPPKRHDKDTTKPPRRKQLAPCAVTRPRVAARGNAGPREPLRPRPQAPGGLLYFALQGAVVSPTFGRRPRPQAGSWAEAERSELAGVVRGSWRTCILAWRWG